MKNSAMGVKGSPSKWALKTASGQMAPLGAILAVVVAAERPIVAIASPIRTCCGYLRRSPTAEFSQHIQSFHCGSDRNRKVFLKETRRCLQHGLQCVFWAPITKSNLIWTSIGKTSAEFAGRGSDSLGGGSKLLNEVNSSFIYQKEAKSSPLLSKGSEAASGAAVAEWAAKCYKHSFHSLNETVAVRLSGVLRAVFALTSVPCFSCQVA